MKREYPAAPVVGVGAVVVDNGKVLLVRRGHEPLRGEWSLPGGALELGETLEEGVAREVWEETGLRIRPVAIVEVLDKIVRDPGEEKPEDASGARVRYHYVLVDFLCEPAGGTLHAASDADEARWVEREQLNSHSAYKVAPFTMAVIEKALRMAEGRPVSPCFPNGER